jgi:hypothetical protein
MADRDQRDFAHRIVAIDKFNGTDTGGMIWDAIARRI